MSDVAIESSKKLSLPSLALRFLNSLKKHGKSVNTIGAYKNDLSLFCEFIETGGWDLTDFGAPIQDYWTDFLKKKGRHSPASLRRAQMSVRTFMHFIKQEGYIESTPFLEVKSPKQPDPSLLIVPETDYQDILKALQVQMAGGDDKSKRDYALILLIGECGLKVSEVCALRWDDLLLYLGDQEGGGILKISGEHNRIIPFNSTVKQGIEALAQAREKEGLSSEPEDCLFYGYQNISRKPKTTQLQRHGIKFILYEIFENVVGKPYNAESLRNRSIYRWLHIDKLPIEKVGELAGYSSLNSLERFFVEENKNRKPKRKNSREIRT